MAAGSIIVELMANTGSFETDTQRAAKSLKALKNGIYEVRTETETFNARFDSLTNTYRKISAAQNEITHATQKSMAGFRNANQIITNTSYQVTDFIVQVQGGVSAMRAFSQQAPQFLGAFGTKGAALGIVAALAGAFIPLIDSAINGAKAMKSFDDATEAAQKGMNKFSAAQVIESMRGIEIEGRKAIARLYELRTAAMGDALKEEQNKLTGVSYDVTLGDEGRIQAIAEKWKLSGDQAKMYWDIATGSGKAETLINNLDMSNKKHQQLAEQLSKVQEQQQKVADATKGSAEVQKAAINGVYDTIKTKAARPDNTLEKMFNNQRVGADKFVESMQRANEQVEFQSSLLGKSAQEVEILNAQYRIQAELEKTIQDIERQNGTIRAEEFEKMKAAAEEALAIQTDAIMRRQELERSASYGIENSIRMYTDSANNMAKNMEGVFTNAFKGMENAIVQFAMTGKGSFADFANSVIADIMRIYIRMAITGLIGQVAGAFAGSGGMSSSTQASTYGGAGQQFSNTVGGVSSWGSMKYADGGYTGDGSKYQPAGVVHAGEFVMNKEATSRIGVGNLYRMMRGYADGGLVGSAPLAGAGANGGQVNINIKNEAGGDGYQATAKARKNDSGFDIDILVRKALTNDLRSNGPMTQTIGATFGLRRSA